MKLKIMMATLLASVATVVAAVSSNACLNGWDEPTCPESLIN